jgi:class 3 adenylate cyclase/tetratricopeptide (TPR) repeat protein
MAKSVGVWLRELELGAYAQAFEENQLLLEHLPDLSEHDLKELGVSAMGHRKTLMRAIAALSNENAEATSVNPTLAASSDDSKHAERRQLTVMFVDLVGSTALSGELDPEEMREAITIFQNTVAGVVTRYDGHIAKYMGDGVLCYFGWPRAHEDDAERAVRAGLAIMLALKGLSAANGQALVARSGVATGLVVVGDLVGEGAAQEEAVVGETPNLASRLQSLAEPGQVILADSTRQLVGSVFNFIDLGEHELRGIAGLTKAFAALGEHVAETRFAARQSKQQYSLVGRKQELALLQDRWLQAKAGEGQMVLLSGEAGIGKSRIVSDLIDALSHEDYVRISYQCSPYHSDSALYPAVQQLTHGAGIANSDGPDTKLNKLEALLTRSSSDVSDAAPIIANLLGIEADGRYGPVALSPPQLRAKTFEVMINQLFGLSQTAPVLFLLEDAHWIDPTTLELIEQTVSRVEHFPVLILITARPTFSHPITGHPIATRLTLNRVGREQTLAIVNNITGGKILPPTVLEEIVARTDGVPLFVEELCKTLLESGMLRETETAFEPAGSLENLEIPSSLHDSLMARLDRLQPVKEVAQMASCIGREFSIELLASLSPLSQDKLRDALEKLISAELLFRRGTPPTESYIFKHALVRDAAYESLLKSKRKTYHADLVNVLQKEAGSAPEIIAHHATQAGLIDQAAASWLMAGRLAISSCAFSEAIANLENGLEVLAGQTDSPERLNHLIEFHSALGVATISSLGYGSPEVQQHFERVLDLSQKTGDSSKQFIALHGLWWYSFTAQSVERARELGLELLSLAKQSQRNDWEIMAYRACGYGSWLSGHFASGLETYRHGVSPSDSSTQEELASRFGGAAPGIALNAVGAHCLWSLGWPDQALEVAQRNLALLQALNHEVSECFAYIVLGQINQQRGSAQEVYRYAEQVLNVAESLSFPLYAGWAKPLFGWAKFKADANADCITMIQEGIQLSDNTGTIVMGSNWRGLLAEACLEFGELNLCGKTLDEAEALQLKLGEGLWAAEISRLRGRLYLANSDTQLSERYFQKAIAIAQEQKAKSWELRASTSLSRLWAEAGDRQKARDLLEPLYNWFTEGFDTVDLREARQLLQELG